AGLAVLWICTESRVVAEPAQAVAHASRVLVSPVRSAALDGLAGECRRAPLQLSGGDDDRGDARAGHAAVAVVPFFDVAPGAVLVLGLGEVIDGPLPSFAGNGRLPLQPLERPFAFVQAQQGELAIGVVAIAAGSETIVPHAGVEPSPNLLINQPLQP